VRTPQKRYYIDDAVCFITVVTRGRFPFFRQPMVADVFVIDLWFASAVKDFTLLGYTIAYDHAHLLVQPHDQSNISNIVGSVKRNVSRDINDIIHNRSRLRSSAGDDSNRPLQDDLETMKASFEAMKAAHPTFDPAILERHFHLMRDRRAKFYIDPKAASTATEFRWQRSFYDHIIRGDHDLRKHLDYIHDNARMHGLENAFQSGRWMWVLGMDKPGAFQ
jgi:REP element-mobilizing transposase RayT